MPGLAKHIANARKLLFILLLLGSCGQAFAATNELNSCELITTEKGLLLVLSADEPLTFSTYWLRDPLRLLVEFPATRPSKSFALPKVNPNALLRHLKIEKSSEYGGMTRLTLETVDVLDFEAKPDGNRLRIHLRPLLLAMNAEPKIEHNDALERQKAEEKRLAEEEQAKRLREEALRAEEAAKAARLAEEQRLAKEAEMRRLALEKRQAEEAAARLAEEKRIAEEAALKARLAEEKRLADAKRAAEEAETRRLAEAALAARLAEEAKAKELAAQKAEEERQHAEASRLAALPVKRLGELAAFVRLGFQAQGVAAVVWFDLSTQAPLDYEWKDKETLLVRLSQVRVQNRVNLYPLNTEAFGSVVRYVRPDYDPKAHVVTLSIGVIPNTQFRVEMEKRRVELLFGAAKPVLPLPPVVKVKNTEGEESAN